MPRARAGPNPAGWTRPPPVAAGTDRQQQNRTTPCPPVLSSPEHWKPAGGRRARPLRGATHRRPRAAGIVWAGWRRTGCPDRPRRRERRRKTFANLSQDLLVRHLVPVSVYVALQKETH